MAALAALYLQDPFWIWLALACAFVALSLATGSGRLVLPALAAAVVALVEVAGLRAGLLLEVLLFLVFTGAAFGAANLIARKRSEAGPSAPVAPTAPAPLQYQTPAERKAASQGRTSASPVTTNAERQARSERLIGRIGKTTSEFANGVGRVWIDNAEWGAELSRGSHGSLPAGSPVRIIKVIGGIRLQVESLQTG